MNTTLSVEDIQQSTIQGLYKTSLSILYEDKKHSIYFSSYDIELNITANSILPMLLVPALAVAKKLKIPSLSPKLEENSKQLQSIYTTWYSDLNKVKIESSALEITLNEPKKPLTAQKTACFFSGGVDSFYTLLSLKKDVDAIIYVHGFDVDINDIKRRKKISEHLIKISAEFNVQLIEIETNLRTFSDTLSPWGSHYVSSALAAIAHLISGSFNTVYITTDDSYNMLLPWGNHLLTTPLWSSEELYIKPYAADKNRYQRTEFISSNKTVQNYLRVCWKNPNEKINCGQCEKCLRTITALFLLNRLTSFKLFSQDFSPTLLRQIEMPEFSINHWKNMLTASLSSTRNLNLMIEIENLLNRFYFNQLKSNIPNYKKTTQVILNDKLLKDYIFNDLFYIDRSWLFKKIAIKTIESIKNKLKT